MAASSREVATTLSSIPSEAFRRRYRYYERFLQKISVQLRDEEAGVTLNKGSFKAEPTV